MTTALGYHANLPITDPASIVAEQVPVPKLGPHDLLVEVKAVSMNPVDVKLRAGAPTDGLRTLGFDAAGVVRAAGDAVTLFTPGDEVYYAGSIDRSGTNQRLHAVDERIVGHKPSTLSFPDAAALPLTAITAWESLFDRLRLTADSVGTLLVIGATGGVGSMLLQLAEALLPNVQVVATASDRQRQEWVRDLGAEHVVDHHDDLVQQIQTITPTGVDWVFTAHSAGQIPLYAEIVKPFGAVVAIDDGVRDIEPLKPKSISWHWEFMFTRPLHSTPDLSAQHSLLDEVAALVDVGRVRSTATHVLTPISPANLREAHRLLETERTIGKVVLHDWQE